MKKILSIFFTILSFSNLQGDNVERSLPSTVLSEENRKPFDSQIVIDADGNVLTIWVDNDVIKSRAKFNFSEWHSEETLSGTHASSPSLVMDNNGNATAIWIENGFLKGASKKYNNLWGSPKTLSRFGVSSPSLCVDADGNVLAAWTRAGNVETSTKFFDENWEDHVEILSFAATSPKIAIGGSGSCTRAIIIWRGLFDETKVVYSTNKLITGNWSSPEIISQPEQNIAEHGQY